MDYPLTLEVAVFLVGSFLVASHLFALLRAAGPQPFVELELALVAPHAFGLSTRG